MRLSVLYTTRMSDARLHILCGTMLCISALLIGCDDTPVMQESLSGATPIFEEQFDAVDWEQRWQHRYLTRHTEYARVLEDGNPVMEAVSRHAASFLLAPAPFDPAQYQMISWRWTVLEPLEHENLHEKSGSDTAARIGVIFDSAAFSWRKKTINYVWSSALPAGTEVFSAYTKYVGMIVIRDASDVGQWQSESRNLVDDYRRLFSEDPPAGQAVAIMTDSDNSHGTARARFDDIRIYQSQ
jgi:hypothetical protein